MTSYYQIKDHCRQGLIKYLEMACTKIPKDKHQKILDIGCGTGVPTLWLADYFPGIISAIDKDEQAIGVLQEKIRDKNFKAG